MKKHPQSQGLSNDLQAQNQLEQLFVSRHIGPSPQEIEQMVRALGLSSLQDLVERSVPEQIRTTRELALGKGRTEDDVLSELSQLAKQNEIYRSYIGMGYSSCITPSVIQRNILENPGWYTQYTPYQAEIAQGRLEALLNFQTLITELTGLPVANASLLDEATAAAEAMNLSAQIKGKSESGVYYASAFCHPQTLAVLRTRAEPLGIQLRIEDPSNFDFTQSVVGVLLQYPTTDGGIFQYEQIVSKVHASGGLVTFAVDLMSLALLQSPGALGADIAVGSAQRFGVPLGYGGPHAAFFATKEEFKRQIPGRIVGVSKDIDGRPAIRLALQTREQHIRRDKATSNICTAQVLLAIMASMYAIYHGPHGIRQIAERIHRFACILNEALSDLGYYVEDQPFFDTLRVVVGKDRMKILLVAAERCRVNLRVYDDYSLCVALDETVKLRDLEDLVTIFSSGITPPKTVELKQFSETRSPLDHGDLRRKDSYLTHPVFNSYHSETELVRYIFRLQAKDFSLVHSMIPLGSCTMKLNATSEMLPVTWPEFGGIHPFVPVSQARGYALLLGQLEADLKEITGFAAVSLQPNAGSQGEYAGLLVIRKYLQSRGQSRRNICLIPRSAHGTNPASAVMAGMQVVVIDCDANGNIDLTDLNAKVDQYKNELAVLMMTYPSTHGVFEDSIVQVCRAIHENGGQVYMDGANMNAQIGICRPGEFGPDVCHINLHKTFCIPHGGGGPGMGPICVAQHLAPFLPSHPITPTGGESAIGSVSAAAWGSAGILCIPWMYIRMMGSAGLTQATRVALLNANYIARKLEPHFPILYRGKGGWVAHECIFDLRRFKETANIDVEDVAKRLMDYGFHAPTVSFPVAGTMMVEPTESESKSELDRFCDAMISIRREIQEIEDGAADRQSNVLKNAPHTVLQVAASHWDRPYSREQAAFPIAWVRENKFWPSVGRINNVLGDRNLVCACPPVDAYVAGS